MFKHRSVSFKEMTLILKKNNFQNNPGLHALILLKLILPYLLSSIALICICYKLYQDIAIESGLAKTNMPSGPTM